MGEPGGSTFNASFLVPFEREALFKEVIKPDRPLGIDTGRVNITVKKHGQKVNEISENCIRIAEFSDGSGTTTSRLVRLEYGKTVVWEELESTIKSMRMIGSGSQKPLFTTTMSDAPRGTKVELKYDFHSVQLPGVFGTSVTKSSFPTHISDSLPDAVKAAWTSDMLSRGFTKLTTDDAGLGGFEVAFTLQFKRKDVWKELTDFYRPLGASNGVIYSQGADGQGGTGRVNSLTVGLLRKADITGDEYQGWTLSELVDLRDGAFIKWRQINHDLKGTEMLGKGDIKPEVSMSLSDSAMGTSVKLKYDFYKVGSSAGMTADKMQMQFLHNAAETWTADMVSRGYSKELPKFSPGSAFINRSRDQAEEDAIKNKAATPRMNPLEGIKAGIEQLFTPRGSPSQS